MRQDAGGVRAVRDGRASGRERRLAWRRAGKAEQPRDLGGRILGQEVGQGAAIEHRQEGGERLPEHVAEPAGRRDRTGAGREALDQGQILLGLPHDGADRDLARGPAQPEAAPAPARRADQAELPQPVDHLHQVGLRDAVGRGDPGDRALPRLLQPDIDQGAQGVIGEAGQAHCASLLGILYTKVALGGAGR